MSRDIDWDLVAALYADHSIPLKEIERRCAVSRHTITARAAREGWPRRRPGRRSSARRPQYRTLINRMFRTLDKQMRDIEQRLKTDPVEREATERERDARTLAALTRALEKLCDLEKEAAREESETAAADDGEKGADTETMHAELQRRLARLIAATGEKEISGKFE